MDESVEGIYGGDDQEFYALPLFFSHGDYMGEQLLFIASEELIVTELVFAGAGGELADGHHDDVVTAHVGFLEGALQMVHAMVIAYGD